MREQLKEKEIIFVGGTSESGKSGGINYIIDNYSEVQHIKIRDVFPKIYAISISSLNRISRIFTHYNTIVNLPKTHPKPSIRKTPEQVRSHGAPVRSRCSRFYCNYCASASITAISLNFFVGSFFSESR